MSIFDGNITLTQSAEDMAKLSQVASEEMTKLIKCAPFYTTTYSYTKYRDTSKDTITKVMADIKNKPSDMFRQVIFNPPYTTVVWSDGSSTVVKASDGEPFSPYYGICVAVCKKLFESSNALSNFVNEQIRINDARIARKNKKADKKSKKITERKDAELMKAEKKE